MDTSPFRIDVKQAALDDVRERVARTRWPDEPEGADWSMGTDLSFMKRLADHWLNQYDWRVQEAAMNAHPQFIADVDGTDMARSFDVVIPSLPGFGFSARTPLSVDAGADKLAQLMAGLGYDRYVAGGADGPIPIALSQRHTDALRGIYVVDVGYPDGSTDFSTLSPPELEFATWIQDWWMREGAFT